jgi:predicted short-subunit dehydrogenase-like oxidoreductase (DUF2520 family)
VSSSAASAQRCAEFVQCSIASSHLQDISRDSEIVLIAAPDSAVSNVATELATNEHLRWNTLTVAHTSGVLTTNALLPLKAKGARVLSIHPLYAFPDANSALENLAGIFYGIEGDSSAVEIGKNLVSDLGGKSIVIPQDSKTLYHIAAVFGSNYLVTLISLVGEVFSSVGLPRNEFFEVVEPLIQNTLRNIKQKSTLDALTGPIERGDLETVRLHLEELRKKLPYIIPVYVAMGLETIRLALRKGSVSDKQAAAMLDFMSDFIQEGHQSARIA